MSCCTEQLAMATKSLAMASWTISSLAMSTDLLAMASLDSQLSGKIQFSLQNPNFESPMPKFVPKVCLNVYRHKKTLKSI